MPLPTLPLHDAQSGNVQEPSVLAVRGRCVVHIEQRRSCSAHSDDRIGRRGPHRGVEPGARLGGRVVPRFSWYFEGESTTVSDVSARLGRTAERRFR